MSIDSVMARKQLYYCVFYKRIETHKKKDKERIEWNGKTLKAIR